MSTNGAHSPTVIISRLLPCRRRGARPKYSESRSCSSSRSRKGSQRVKFCMAYLSRAERFELIHGQCLHLRTSAEHQRHSSLTLHNRDADSIGLKPIFASVDDRQVLGKFSH